MAAAKKVEVEDEEEFVLEEESDSRKASDVRKGEVQRYEVRLGPPIVSGRKIKPLRSEEPLRDVSNVQAGQEGGIREKGGKGVGVSYANSQHIYKIEDDLRRTRDIVEDLKHTTSLLEGDMRDLKAEMDRISYLLRSLEGLKNAMKDIESTVSELSGLYDLISANVNPFIDIPKMMPKDEQAEPPKVIIPPVPKKEKGFTELKEIFEEVGDDDSEPTAAPARVRSSQDLESEEWTIRWTKFLMERVGKEGLEKTLEHYKGLGWIDEALTQKVLEIARGTASQSLEGKRANWRMDAEDHVRSLEHIRNIRGMKRDM